MQHASDVSRETHVIPKDVQFLRVFHVERRKCPSSQDNPPDLATRPNPRSNSSEFLDLSMFHVKHRKHAARQPIWADHLKTTKPLKASSGAPIRLKADEDAPKRRERPPFRRKTPKISKKNVVIAIFLQYGRFFWSFSIFFVVFAFFESLFAFSRSISVQPQCFSVAERPISAISTPACPFQSCTTRRGGLELSGQLDVSRETWSFPNDY